MDEKAKIKSKQNELKSFIGKKLVWAGYDSMGERFYMFFEDMSSLAVEEFYVVDGGAGVAKAILDDNLDEAEHVLALKKVLSVSPGLSVESVGAQVTMTLVAPQPAQVQEAASGQLTNTEVADGFSEC